MQRIQDGRKKKRERKCYCSAVIKRKDKSSTKPHYLHEYVPVLLGSLEERFVKNNPELQSLETFVYLAEENSIT